MRVTLATSIVALAVSAGAVPQPVGQRNSRAIPITKRSSLVNADKSVNFDAVHSHLESIKAYVLWAITSYPLMHHFSKIHRGFANYEQNTGLIHPAVSNVSQKRGAGGPLNNYEGEHWYGTISVGTPPTSFNGWFLCAPKKCLP